ncbi:RNA polymerase I-specific transcription initiation factor RRN3 [Hemiscyllium ocellatum]|uniref:RNA polymerase I-specific transcription initiation factor RRN3 n=1 Tax=Hemiscyllium ocellatum TaxID=170820 RepID=UPI0029676B98|nr:RNA polymerase I-specific transcription initiation factor RRN3 [Hemiscyllium ocellatum]
MTMLGESEFFSSPPRKAVRFGGTVTEILKKYKQGDTVDYDLLMTQLDDPEIKDAQIINWLQEFRDAVAQLTKEFEHVVSKILKLPWLSRSPMVIEEYLAFLSNLVSAQTVYLRSCLSMLVSSFVPGRIVIQENGVDISDSEDEDENLPRNFNICHRALQIITKYVPSTPQFLMPILVEKFPFANKSARILECYVHNLLRITVYFPVLRLKILELVVEKFLKLDVSASRNDIEDAEETVAETKNGLSTCAEEGLFDMDEDEGKQKIRLSPPNDEMAHPVAERLDILMSVLLAYIKDICYDNGELVLTRTKELYRDLIVVFDKLVLPTHASCHVQYFMFYICSFKLGLAEAFLEHLWKMMQNPNNPAVIRQAAAGYIGSFLARATYIPVVTVKTCLDLLVPWIHDYIDSQDAGTKAYCDVALHGSFYSACQAVFYIFVFRYKQILDGNLKMGLTYLQNLNFERIVMCQLNPLKVCLPSVVNLFAAITRKYQLAFCYTVIERNNRQLIPVVKSSTGGHLIQICTNPLDSFFPFDPYILKRSKKIFDGIYRVWEDLSLQDIQAPQKITKLETAEDEEDDDFLKGESLPNETIGITPNSFESHMHSPSSVGSPPAVFPLHHF